MNGLAVVTPLEKAYDQSRQNFEQIVRYLDSGEARRMTHSELERELEKKSRESLIQVLFLLFITTNGEQIAELLEAKKIKVQEFLKKVQAEAIKVWDEKHRQAA